MFFAERLISIGPNDKVLEIGPGGTPHPRSDVFLDLDPSLFKTEQEALHQRGSAPELNVQKPVIYYDGKKFPFKDKEFDYIIASHVLEHVDDIDLFLHEVGRVGKKGYIEYPNVLYDYLYNIDVHFNLLHYSQLEKTIYYIKKKDTSIYDFLPVQQFFFTTLNRGYDDIVRDLKEFMMEGFEWEGSPPILRKASSISQIVGDFSKLKNKQALQASASPAIPENSTSKSLKLPERPILEPDQARVQSWFAIDGDNNLRVDYDLSKSSIVYDVGGYKGDWAEAIYERFGCHIEIFEPVREFVGLLQKRFKDNEEIVIHDIGLAGKTRQAEISLEEASSSVVKAKGKTETIKLVAASEAIDKSQKIDLMKMNIEGGEYELLDNLMDSGLVKNIKDIQIQFHVFIKDYEKRRSDLQKRLSKTHYLTYNYPYIWENWRLK